MTLNAAPLGTAPRIVVLTSDESALPDIQQFLASTFHTTLLNTGAEVIALLEQAALEAVVVDLDTVSGSPNQGPLLVAELHRLNPDLVLLGLTRSRSRILRQKAERAGVDEFFVAPVDFHQLADVLRQTLERRRREIEARQLKEEAHSRYSFCDLIGGCEAMRLVYEAISRVAAGTATVLLRGESGTGKELVARAIVASSPRRDHPFISVNCAALPESLIEAELFGHERGAFTGAHESRAGHIEAAHGGTLFLDEIGTLDLALQSKLLRVIEQRMVQRLGGKTAKKIDFRLITATNEDLEEAVRTGRFREDLYYRINVVPLHLPPLRDREGDIALLVDHFLRLYCAANEMPLKRMDPEALEVLEDYPWPGNVRELENLIQRLVLMTPGAMIDAKHLPQHILYHSTAKQESLLIPEEGISFDEEIARIEVAYLQAALRRTGGRKAAAARLLRIDPQKMKYLCRKYGLAVNN
jgi:two-component system response regulator PilR (NtrC family)